MKTRTLLKYAKLARNIALCTSALAMAAQVQAAPWAGSQSGAVSGYEHIEVGISVVPFGPHSMGNAGIGVSSFPGFGTAGKVDFEGLTDGLTGPIFQLEAPITEAPETHDELGVFSFARAGSGDVWYGEWSENGDTPAKGGTYNGRQVYYQGDDADESIPGSATAPVQVTYNVTGINNAYSSTGVLSGQFDASFYGSAGTLTGDITDANGFTIDIGNATISDSAAISGSGATAADSGDTLATSGTVDGHFFNDQDALAGIVDFGAGSDYNTAFGGQAQ